MSNLKLEPARPEQMLATLEETLAQRHAHRQQILRRIDHLNCRRETADLKRPHSLAMM